MNTVRYALISSSRLTKIGLAKSSSISHAKTPNKSFIVNAFAGGLKLDQIFPYPQVLTQEESETIESMIEPINKYFKEENDAFENDRKCEISQHAKDKMGQLGFYGLITPVEYGGLGLNSTQTSRLSEQIGHFDLSVMIHIGAHQSIGYRGIINYGTEEQKAKYLPDLSSGKRIAAYCLTEPSAGSDAASIKSRAVLSADGRHYVLNGSKIWITNGAMADVMTVFAQTPVRDEEGKEKMRMTAFIVERDFGGVSSGKPVSKMGINASETCEVFFDDVHIPVENVLGEVGSGFNIAVNILNMGRSSICASMCGTMKEMLTRSIAFAKDRTQFGSKIVEYAVIQEKLAKMAMKIYASESIGYLLAANYDRKLPDLQVDAAICKIYGSDSAWSVIDDAIQIHGGMGYMRDTGLERVARDARICRIFEGTNEILKLFVALNGLKHAGSVLSDMIRSIKNPLRNVSGITSMITNSVLPSSTVSKVNQMVHQDLLECGRQFGSSVDSFGKTVMSLLRKYRQGVKDRQFELYRVGEIAISLHVMAAVISRASNALERESETCRHEAELCRAICSEEFSNVYSRLESIQKSDLITPALFKISEDVVSRGEYFARNPTGVQ